MRTDHQDWSGTILQIDRCATQDVPCQLFHVAQVDDSAKMNLRELVGVQALPKLLERRTIKMPVRCSDYLPVLRS